MLRFIGEIIFAALYVMLYLGNYFWLHYILRYIWAIIFGCVIYYALFEQLFLAALYITLYLGNYFWLLYIFRGMVQPAPVLCVYNEINKAGPNCSLAHCKLDTNRSLGLQIIY